MLSHKFAKWLERLAGDLVRAGETKEHGKYAGLASRIGVDKTQLSTWKTDKRANVDLERLERIVRRARPKAPLHEVIREIELEADIVQPPSKLHRIEEQYIELWHRLFVAQPGRAERVAKNIIDSEDLGLTELMNHVVRLIIDLGPKEAAGEVATLLTTFQQEKSAALTRKRRRMAADYKRISRS